MLSSPDHFFETSDEFKQIKGDTENALAKLWTFTQSGVITIDHTIVSHVLSGADYLQMDEVKSFCFQFLTAGMSVENVLEARRLAGQYSSSELLEAADEFVNENFVEVSRTRAYEKEEKDAVVELLSSSKLNVSSELFVFDAVVTWVSYDRKQRGEHMHDLLRHVRLPLLPLNYIVEVVQVFPECQRSAQCRQLVKSAVDLHADLDALRSTFPAEHLSKRSWESEGKTNTSSGMNSSAELVEVFDTSSGKWV